MKKSVRLFSLILCLLLVLPIGFSVSVGADAEKELTLQNLGWRDTTGTYASLFGMTYEAEISTDGIGEMGNKSLFLYSSGSDSESDWHQIEIVPAEKLSGVKKYSLSFKMKLTVGREVTWHNLTMFHFGKTELGTKDGDWVGVRYGTDGGGELSVRSCYYENGTRGANKIDVNLPTGGTLDLRISVDTEAKTVKVYDGAGSLLSERTTPFADIGPIGLVLNRTYGWIDDLKLVNDETNAVLYEENFESFKAPKAKFDVLGALGWKQDTVGYTGSTYSADITTQFGAEGNKALKLVEEESNWCGIELVSAEKLSGVKKYTISADMVWESAKTFSFRFGDEAVNGDVVGISWNTRLWNALTAENDSGAANYEGDKIAVKQAIRLLAEIDTEAGTVAVSVNGEKVSERSDATKTVGGIYLILRSVVGFLDNIEVKNVESGAVIYSENFESYPVTEIVAPTRPEQDYTGHSAGEVIFSDNYDKAESVDDLYFTYESNSGFSKAKWGLSDKINGTGCAMITGSWSQVEIIPKEVCATYKSYTIHMTVMMDSNDNRFTVMYNSDEVGSNSNSGFFDMRYSNPLKIENLGIIGGTVSKDETTTQIQMGQAFDLALSVDCENGTATAYINGEYASFVSGVNKKPSAIWIVAEKAVGYIDNVSVTAGSYADWVNKQNPEPAPTPSDTDDGESTGEKLTAEKVTVAETEATTASEKETEDKGCKSMVATLLPVMLLAMVGTAVVVRRRKQ